MRAVEDLTAGVHHVTTTRMVTHTQNRKRARERAKRKEKEGTLRSRAQGTHGLSLPARNPTPPHHPRIPHTPPIAHCIANTRRFKQLASLYTRLPATTYPHLAPPHAMSAAVADPAAASGAGTLPPQPQADAAATDDPCAASLAGSYDLHWHVAAIFIIMSLSFLGTMLPMIGRRVSAAKVNNLQ